MAELQLTDPSKAEAPTSTFGKILAATPVVMTVIATLLAGLASSEMTSAQYDRSLAAQQQSKAGDQWSYFQGKRLRSALQQNALDLVHATADIHPLDLAALKQAVAQAPPGGAAAQTELRTSLDSPAGKEALAALDNPESLKLPDAPPVEPKLQATIDAIVNGQPDAEITPLLAGLSAAKVEAALRSARDRAQSFDALAKSMSQTIDHLEGLLFRNGATEGKGLQHAFAAARLRFGAQRYDLEARLNQAIGNLHEVQVHISNFTAERHRVRSERFFYGMLIAQAAVIVSTLAMAARQRNILWFVAAVAGLVAIGFAVYVYLCV